jgi:hypothetical protein
VDSFLEKLESLLEPGILMAAGLGFWLLGVMLCIGTSHSNEISHAPELGGILICSLGGTACIIGAAILKRGEWTQEDDEE